MHIEPTLLRKAQLIMLEMLEEFDTICQKHHLAYWLDSGTTLGALRHQGFIPWDDDIDISMPCEDYAKFATIAQKELSSSIFFQNSHTDKDFPFDYMKLRSNKATIIEFHEAHKNITYHQGIFVDIFPMQTIKNSPFHLWYYTNSFKLIRLFSPKYLNFKGIRKLLVTSLERMHQGWEKKNLKVIYSGKMPDVSASFDIDKVFPLQQMPFEKKHFYMPRVPSHYLENIYSFNYMELPSKEQRVNHAHKVIIHD